MGAEGRASGDSAGLANTEIVDPNLAGKLAGIDQAALGTVLGWAGAGAAGLALKGKALWAAAKTGGVSAVAGKSAATVSAATKGASVVRGVSKVAVPLAVAAEVGVRGYQGYQIEQKHDTIEEAARQGLVGTDVMERVAAERNVGHVRNVAGGAGGLAGMWAGMKVGGAIGVAGGALTGPGALILSPVLGVTGAIAGGVAGYYYGGKIAEGAVNVVSGCDGSYSHTNRALDRLNNGVGSLDPAEAGKSWAQARDKSGYQSGTHTPGLSNDPEVQQQFNRSISPGYQVPSTPEAVGGGVVAPLQRGESNVQRKRQTGITVSRAEM